MVAQRMDMDQSQFPSDVSPLDDNGNPLPGIYDTLIPILQQWKSQYDFVGSYYVNIGDTPTSTDPATTDWARSLPYYRAIEAFGERDRQPLLHPPYLSTHHDSDGAHRRRYAGALGPGDPGHGAIFLRRHGRHAGHRAQHRHRRTYHRHRSEKVELHSANTIVTAVSGNTLTLSFLPGDTALQIKGSSATYQPARRSPSPVPRNTNFLQTEPAQSPAYPVILYVRLRVQSVEADRRAQLGHPIYGATVPGAPRHTRPTRTSSPTTNQVTATPAIMTGGWTGVGAGYPGAIGFMSPYDQDSVYCRAEHDLRLHRDPVQRARRCAGRG